jgi:hypothetical protein
MSNGFSVGAERVCLIWTAVVKNLPHNSSRRAKNVMDSSTKAQLHAVAVLGGDLALDKAFVIIDRQDPRGGNVAPLTAECYSESRLSNRKTAGRKVCVEPAAL